jgi:hypothetical protein
MSATRAVSHGVNGSGESCERDRLEQQWELSAKHSLGTIRVTTDARDAI